MNKQIKEDIELIYNAVEFVYDKRVNYIFEDKTRINNTKIAAYNHSTVFLIDPLKKEISEYPFKVPDKLMIGWQAILKAEIYEALPKEIKNQSRFDHPIISGSLCTEFIKHQESIEGWYTTIESFLATILHEYAHIYYNSYKSYFFHDKKENLRYLERALEILKGESKESIDMWGYWSKIGCYLLKIFVISSPSFSVLSIGVFPFKCLNLLLHPLNFVVLRRKT